MIILVFIFGFLLLLFFLFLFFILLFFFFQRSLIPLFFFNFRLRLALLKFLSYLKSKSCFLSVVQYFLICFIFLLFLNQLFCFLNLSLILIFLKTVILQMSIHVSPSNFLSAIISTLLFLVIDNFMNSLVKL